MLKVKRLHPNAKLPTRNNESDAGLDLYAIHDAAIDWSSSAIVGTGISMAIPVNFVGLIFDRSSMGSKGMGRLAGVIDASYRGEIKVIMANLVNRDTYYINTGDKIAQILIMPVALLTPIEVDELDETIRGGNGFGSSGR